jgi:hypothetical protein
MAPSGRWPRAGGGLALSLTLLAARTTAPAPRYQADQFDCSRWAETIRSEFRTESGRTERATAGRDALWAFRSRPAGDSVALEGWFDSLAVWRESGGKRLEPDTDGLIGGRYVGRLGPAGGYRSLTLPFIPDEVRLVADLTGAPGDLFPPLPLRSLEVGTAESDSGRGVVTRLADSATGHGPVERYRLVRRLRLATRRTVNDSLTLTVDQDETEDGVWSWDPGAGLVAWSRRIVAETTIPARGAVTRPIHSHVEQRVTLVRLASACPS